MEPRLTPDEVAQLLAGVEAAEDRSRLAWPGEPATRQPLQVLYVPADRVGADLVRTTGAEALRLLAMHAGTAERFAAAFGIDEGALLEEVRTRVTEKLERQPIEDLRVDVEDGYLGRGPAEEASDVVAAARALAAMHRDGTAPPFLGIRVKSFSDGLARRSVDSLDRFVGTLLDELGALPDGFVVTFPKIVAVEHVAAFAAVLTRLEAAHDLPTRRLRFEVQIETTPSVLGPAGEVVLRDIRAAGAGRICAAHLGVYDYTAGLGLPPSAQRLQHPACDFVRHLLQVTFAGTEVRLSDGSSNAVPSEDTTSALHRVWEQHGAAVRHSLAHGYVQGWDLHPSHLVGRYAVVFAELLTGMEEVLARLARWYAADHAAGPAAGDAAGDGAGSADGVLDEPATIRRLEAQVQRAIDCGAISPERVADRTGRRLAQRPATLLDHAADGP